MFEIGWTEMLVIAIVMIVVVGPKDLPRMLRTFGKTVTKLRAMAGDFQKQFNEALKEAELDDVKKSVDAIRGLNPVNEIKKSLNPFEQAAADVRSGIDSAMKPKPSTANEPAAPVPHEAEPLKNGAVGVAGLAVPEAPPADLTEAAAAAKPAAAAPRKPGRKKPSAAAPSAASPAKAPAVAARSRAARPAAAPATKAAKPAPQAAAKAPSAAAKAAKKPSAVRAGKPGAAAQPAAEKAPAKRAATSGAKGARAAK